MGNEITKFTPSNAVVSIPLSDIDNLRFNLLSVTQELEKYKDSKAEVVVKQRTSKYGELGGWPITTEEFVEFRKFDEFEEVIKQKVESKFNQTITNLQNELEKANKKVSDTKLVLEKEIENSDKLRIEYKELNKLFKNQEEFKSNILYDLNKRENEIDSLKKLTEQQLNEISKFKKTLFDNSWKGKFLRFLGI